MLFLRAGKRFDYSPALWRQEESGLQLWGLEGVGLQLGGPEDAGLQLGGPEDAGLQLREFWACARASKCMPIRAIAKTPKLPSWALRNEP